MKKIIVASLAFLFLAVMAQAQKEVTLPNGWSLSAFEYGSK
jgi:hypothetical protein